MSMLRKLFTAILALGTIGIQTSLAINTIPYAESFEALATTNINTITNWFSPASDLSSIITSNITSQLPTNCTAPIIGAHNKILKLNTEDGILTNAFGNENIANQLTYLDTLIQFVPSETTPTQLTPVSAAGDPGIKAAAYVNEKTNLVIYHGIFKYSEDQFCEGEDCWTEVSGNYDGTTNTIVTNLIISATNWYRLTITYDSLVYGGLGEFFTFQVAINGQTITNANAYTDAQKAAFLAGTFPAVPGNGTWFYAATKDSDNKTLRSLCFQGTGYLDDLVVTDVTPSFNPLSGPSSYLITVVTGSGGNSKTGGVSLASLSTFTIAANGSTAIVYTARDWYRIASLTSNNVTVAAATSARAYTQQLVNVTADISNNVSFAEVNPGIVNTSLTNIPLSWLTNNNFSETNTLYNNTLSPYELYLLNANPYIAQTTDFRVTGIVANRTNIAVTVGLQINAVNHTNITGYLKLTAKNSLTNATWDLVSQATALNGNVFTNNGTCTYSFVDTISNRFYKAVIEP